jgi:site-specific DNA-adenine methylase
MSIIAWIGSKQKEYINYSDYLNTDHNILVEPFAGSAITSINHFLKYGETKKYHINDNDYVLINFYRNMKKNALEVINEYNNLKNSIINDPEFITKTPQNKAKYKKIIDDYKIKVKERNKESLAAYFLFYSKIYSITNGLYPIRKQNFVDINLTKYSLFLNFINKAKINCKNYLSIFKKYKNNKKALLFLDPPYLASCNNYYLTYSGKDHKEDKIIIDNTKLFIDILNLLKNAKCKIILIINDNALTRFIYKDFIKKSYDVTYRQTLKNTKHLIITNY